jgi:hypothetical protein
MGTPKFILSCFLGKNKCETDEKYGRIWYDEEE